MVCVVLDKQTDTTDNLCVVMEKGSYYPVMLELTNNADGIRTIQTWLTAAEALELAAALEKAAKGDSDETQ